MTIPCMQKGKKNEKNKDQKTFQARGIYLRKKMYKNNAKNIDTLIFVKSHFFK